MKFGEKSGFGRDYNLELAHHSIIARLPTSSYNDCMAKSRYNRVTAKLLKEDQERLATTQLPIVTLSASFRDIVEAEHSLADDINHPDIVLSRAHYSMAYGLAICAWGSDDPDEKQAVLVDPTNYVSAEDWPQVAFTERVGKVLARYPLLTWVKKEVLDRRARSKMPIAETITPPLLDLTKDIKRPIVSFHVELGNILARETKHTIIQAVTDPHVREQYTDYADRPNSYFVVFDEPTRQHFLEIATLRGKDIDPAKVVVTGPFIDPRVKTAGEEKSTTAWKKRPLRILMTTGGVGTNKAELEKALEQLLPLIKTDKKSEAKKTAEPPMDVQLIYYAGTNSDHAEMVRALTKKHKVILGGESEKNASMRLLYGDDIVAANELIVEYGFPWADLVLAKPSGDMAYDAAAAGCALLLLKSWGEWEDNIASIFTRRGIARSAEIDQLVEQLTFLQEPIEGNKSWLEMAMQKAKDLPPEFTDGCQNILKLAKKVGK